MAARRIAIIGAGPAGCAAAITLARSGAVEPRSILLIEARTFPRPRVCGEFLSPAVAGLVERLVGPPMHRALTAAGAQCVDRFVIEWEDRARAWTLPRPTWAIDRGALDALLRDKAAAEGVTVIQPALVRRVGYGSSSVGIELADAGSLESDLVIHADGSGRHDPAGPTPCRKGVVALKCHFRPGRDVQGVRIRSAHGAYIGSVQTGPRLATCAMVASYELVAEHRGDADALLRSVWPDWNPDERDGPWLSCGVPRSPYIPPGHPRSLRIGNAAGAVEPIGGEGIGLALWAGHRAAELIASRGLAAGAQPGIQASLARAYRSRLRFRRPACALAAAALVRPHLVDAAWPLLARPGFTVRPWYALTGKSANG